MSCDPDYEIDPDSTVDYAFYWGSALDGDTIETSEFVLPDGLTEVSTDFTDTTTTIFVNGAEACRKYRVTNRITTLGGRSFDRTIVLVGRSQ